MRNWVRNWKRGEYVALTLAVLSLVGLVAYYAL